jgi:hypothetical protein
MKPKTILSVLFVFFVLLFVISCDKKNGEPGPELQYPISWEQRSTTEHKMIYGKFYDDNLGYFFSEKSGIV